MTRPCHHHDRDDQEPPAGHSIGGAVTVTVLVLLAGLLLGAIALPVYLALGGQPTSGSRP